MAHPGAVLNICAQLVSYLGGEKKGCRDLYLENMLSVCNFWSLQLLELCHFQKFWGILATCSLASYMTACNTKLNITEMVFMSVKFYALQGKQAGDIHSCQN